MVFELLDFSTWDPVTTGTTIFGIIGIAVAMFKGYQKSGIQGMYNAFVDGMTSSVPQTPEQTKAILAAPAETWKMTDDNKDMLWTWLRAKGGEFTRTDLDAVIAQAESEVQVEYAIVIVDHKGNVDETADHAFVSYGYHVSGKYAEIKAKAESTHSKVYHLKTTWVMLDDVKQQLILQIGTSNPKCIEEVTDKIRKMEDEQVEQYYVSCGYHTWEITRGNITRQFAGAKTDEPTE
ncbi:MAG: hypothetical protein PHW97_10815 [Fermentimonas sp.]|nr:hypothetical protein [Fermentimonas sp.]